MNTFIKYLKTRGVKQSLFFILCSWFLVTTSCDDMLKEDYYGNASPSDITSREENLKLLVGQAYADLTWLHDHWGYWGINTLTTDEGVCPVRTPGGHWNDGGYWKNMNTHNWTPEDDAFENLWNTSLGGAVLCNNIIHQLEQQRSRVKDTELLDQYQAELAIVRSYYFYTVFDCFGRIPYSDKFIENPSAAEKPLMEAPEVWKNLVNCLEENRLKVPKKADISVYGRATWGFASALLARLYLNAESYGVTGEDAANSYSNCAKVCQEIIDSHLYSIESDFFANFKIDNSGSKENIFVLVENGNGSFDSRDNGSMKNKLRLTILTLHYSMQQTWGLIEKPWNGFAAPAEFINKYAPADHRGPGNEGKGTLNEQPWGWFVGPVYNTDGSIVEDENGLEVIITPNVKSDTLWYGIVADDFFGNDTNKKPWKGQYKTTNAKNHLENPTLVTTGAPTLDSASWNAGARLLKYEIDKIKTYQYCENDFVLFRYADVLYMQAEAFLRGGSCAGNDLNSLLGSAEFQLIRSRAGIAPYTAATLTLDEMLDERGREFAWENIRHRDLVRFGKFENGNWAGWGAWRGVISGKYLNWFPIPGPVVRKSNGMWTQNKDYPQ
jgi:hypothetical protein